MSLLEIIFGHHILNIYLRHLFTKVCILRWISFVTSQVSHPYKSTDFTKVLNTLISVSFRNDLYSHTLLNLENDLLTCCIKAWCSNLFLIFSFELCNINCGLVRLVYRISILCLVWFVFILPFVFRFYDNATQKIYLLILKKVVTICFLQSKTLTLRQRRSYPSRIWHKGNTQK